MCVIAAKYLGDEFGWVVVKNRDRNYKPTISIQQKKKNGTECLYIIDSVTKYSEGINEYGVCIVNAATSVANDESAAATARRLEKEKKKKEGTYKDPDGCKILKALQHKTPKKAAQSLIKSQMVGHTLIVSEDECWILEGGRSEKDFKVNMEQTELDPNHEWSKMEYVYDLKEIDKKDYIVRTNHGQFLPWLGYQKETKDEHHVFSRKSSETRHDTSIKNLKNAETSEDMIEAISDVSNKDPQLNPLRAGDYNNRKKLKTTGQLCMIPKHRELIYIPIWCYSDAEHFDKVNSPKTKTFFTLKGYHPYSEEFKIENITKIVEEYMSNISNNQFSFRNFIEEGFLESKTEEELLAKAIMKLIKEKSRDNNLDIKKVIRYLTKHA